MNRMERSGADNRTYTNLVLDTLRQCEPYTYFSTAALAAHIESIPLEYADQVVVSTIQTIRKRSHLVSNEAIISVYGSQGYMWTPDYTLARSCQPAGFRSDVFYEYPVEYQQALSSVWDAMRIVDIFDEKTAYPRVKDAVYQDMLYFAEFFGQNISTDKYAQALNRDPGTAFQRIRNVAHFLESVPESGLVIVTTQGFREYRLDVQG